MKRLIVDYEKCRGCYSCTQACSFAKSREFNINGANLSVDYLPEFDLSVPVICLHCTEPECMEACPVQAIFRDKETDAVVIDLTICTGCEICITVCPVGHPRIDINNKNIAKCDLCDGDPECVKYCGYDALQYISVDEETLKQRKEDAIKIAKKLDMLN